VGIEEAAGAGVQVKSHEQMARVGEHHYEGHQWPLRAADLKLAEVRPIGLRLFA
jgi:hypothetical protein